MKLMVWLQLRDERGQTTTEYAILIGFLAIAIIIGIVVLRDNIVDLFKGAGSSIEQAPGNGGGNP